MADEVALAQQQIAPHGLQVLQEQVVTVQDVQQVLAGVEVGHVDLLLERPLQVRQQLCGWEKERLKGVAITEQNNYFPFNWLFKSEFPPK